MGRFGACYQPPFDTLIQRCKYGGEYGLLDIFERLIWRAVCNLPLRRTELECIVAVPATWVRRWQREVDSAWLLANSIAQRLQVQHRSDLLRAHHGPRQAQLTRRERLTNARQRFHPGSGWAPHTVLLVDDVWTTGATLQACAEALRQRGARRIAVVTALRRL